MPAGAGSQQSLPAPYMRTRLGQGTMGLASPWIGPRPFTSSEANKLHEAARFAAAPLAVNGARAPRTARLAADHRRPEPSGVAPPPLRRALCDETHGRPA